MVANESMRGREGGVAYCSPASSGFYPGTHLAKSGTIFCQFMMTPRRSQSRCAIQVVRHSCNSGRAVR